MKRTMPIVLLILGMGILLLSAFGVSEAGIRTWTSHGLDGSNVRALAIDPFTPATLSIALVTAGCRHGCLGL